LKILISNDDGIYAQGIYELATELRKIADVTVVAPLTEQSAIGHAITMKTPLRVTKCFKHKEFFGYSVSGTPADCIKMGIKNILKERPDIVVSGINHGSNTAVSILYSGTVSAAREAAIMDIPAIAISITDHHPQYFEAAAKIAANLCKLVLKNGIRKGTLLNVNVPNLPEEKLKGIRITKQGKSKWADSYVERIDTFGEKYYWLTGNLIEVDTSLEQDQFAVTSGYASITPVHFDVTDYDSFDQMQNWNLDSLGIKKNLETVTKQ